MLSGLGLHEKDPPSPGYQAKNPPQWDHFGPSRSPHRAPIATKVGHGATSMLLEAPSYEYCLLKVDL